MSYRKRERVQVGLFPTVSAPVMPGGEMYLHRASADDSSPAHEGFHLEQCSDSKQGRVREAAAAAATASGRH